MSKEFFNNQFTNWFRFVAYIFAITSVIHYAFGYVTAEGIAGLYLSIFDGVSIFVALIVLSISFLYYKSEEPGHKKKAIRLTYAGAILLLPYFFFTFLDVNLADFLNGFVGEVNK